MKVTRVSMILFSNNGNYSSRTRAMCKIVLEDVLAIHGVRVLEGDDGFYVVMPQRRLTDGSYKDVAHPLDEDFRKYISHEVLKEYERMLGESL